MAALFGFSVGDFIHGILLAKDVIQALSDSRGSSKEFVELGTKLASLKAVLTEIDNQIPHIPDNVNLVPLVDSVATCHELVYDFLTGIEKYHPSLSHTAPRSVWKNTLRKIQWRLCMPEELWKFGGKISSNVDAIGISLHTIQLATTMLHRQTQENDYATLSKTLHTVLLSVQGLDDKLEVRRDRTAENFLQEQVIEALKSTRSTMVEQCQRLTHLYTPIPAQVLSPAPVIFSDAHNRIAPFHLQFIDCWPSFFIVLENLFRDGGAEKVRKKEFLLERSQSRQKIMMNQPWSLSFAPGDRVDMRMVFQSLKSMDEVVGPTCRDCQHRNVHTDKECESCKSSFRLVLDVSEDSNSSTTDTLLSDTQFVRHHSKRLGRKRKVSVLGEAGPTDSESDDRPEKYKRVQVHCRPTVSHGTPGLLTRNAMKQPQQSLLDCYVNAHSSNQSNLHSAGGCRQALEREGIVKRNECLEHNLTHQGQVHNEPSGPDRRNQDDRANNKLLERDDLWLSKLLTKHPPNHYQERRRRVRVSPESQSPGSSKRWSEKPPSAEDQNALSLEVSRDMETHDVEINGIVDKFTTIDTSHLVVADDRAGASHPPLAQTILASEDSKPEYDLLRLSPPLDPTADRFAPESPPPHLSYSASSESSSSESDCGTPVPTSRVGHFYNIPSSDNSETGGPSRHQIGRWRRKKRSYRVITRRRSPELLT